MDVLIIRRSINGPQKTIADAPSVQEAARQVARDMNKAIAMLAYPGNHQRATACGLDQSGGGIYCAITVDGVARAWTTDLLDNRRKLG